ncbi:hypothetical protein MCACP_05700 [Neomoorella carbonis]
MHRKIRWAPVFLVVALIAALLLNGCGKTSQPDTKETKETAQKSNFPTKPINLIVPYAAGGSTDVLARAVEKVWPKYSSQPVLIINKSGSGGVEGREYVARSKPDGYTLLVGYGSGEDLVMPQTQKVPYDVFKDFIPVSRLSIHSVVVAVPANSQFKTLRDIINWAKKENKPVTAAVSTAAGAVDIVMRGIGKVAGINVTPIPHSGGSQALTTLVGGQTVMGGGHPSEVMPHIKAGRLRPIAVALPERDPALPEVPTLKEEGIDFYTWGSVKGVAAPAGTPKEVVAYLADVFKKISEDPDFKKSMAELQQPIMYLGPEEFGDFMQKAYADYGKLLKDLNLTSK